MRLMEDIVKMLALENAIKFKGKANPKALIGALIAKVPSAKTDMKLTMQIINNVVSEVNEMGFEKQKEVLLAENEDYFSQKQEQKAQRKEQRKSLPELAGAEEGKVVMRLPPEPSKYAHVGHAASFLINYLYAQKYKGKCILRFEDTNPEKATQEFADTILDDLQEYLGLKLSSVLYVSDHMDKYYAYAEKLISEDKAYACFCKQAVMKDKRWNMQDCACRGKNDSSTVWEEMKAGKHEDGSVVLRLKIDMSHKNAVMRDPVIFRLSSVEHYKQGTKYKVWPLYDFESAIEDALCGITHVLRSNEFQARIELQEYIRSILGLGSVITKQYGRFSIGGATTKGREIRALIESGEYIGWDDPRLVTLQALKRRGIVKETLYELAKTIGMSRKETNVDYSVLAASNRRILDKTAKRVFALEDPVKITVKDMPSDVKEFKLSFNPDEKDGKRVFGVSDVFYIEKKDYHKIADGQLVRLMDGMNVKKTSDGFEFVSLSYENYRDANEKGSLIHFLPEDSYIKAKVMMEDASFKDVLVEKSVLDFDEGEHVQFERWGFCRLDKKDPLEFWYSHK